LFVQQSLLDSGKFVFKDGNRNEGTCTFWLLDRPIHNAKPSRDGGAPIEKDSQYREPLAAGRGRFRENCREKQTMDLIKQTKMYQDVNHK
jgi:hypothetical protein